ncbi:MAG: phosphatidylglycerophosphatase A [Luteitalea sp.]|nr:phosphatidylglycerophosphatase A [Luteitalea sp.]
MTSVALALATCAGIGYVRWAPGTFGSLAGLLLWYLVPESPGLQIGAIVSVFLVGAWTGGVAERHFGATDPSHVVLDEVVGMWITLLFNPVGWQGAVIAFVLFRVFDVLKPYPADRLERLHGGFGVMADDAMAAIYANMTLRLTIYLLAAFPHWAL